MKKIISLLSAMAMTFAITANVAMADDETARIYWTIDSQTATSITASLHAEASSDLCGGGVELSLTDMNAKGLTKDDVTCTKIDGSNFKINASKNILVATLAVAPSDADNGGDITYGSITIDLTNATGNFSLSPSKETKCVVTPDNSNRVTVDGTDFTGATLNVTLLSAGLGLEVTGAGANNGVFTNGYVWNATITPGEGELTSFNVSFTDSASNVLNKSINNIETLNSWAGLGTSAFQIGLKTARTLTGATFSVADNAEGSASDTWSAN